MTELVHKSATTTVIDGVFEFVMSDATTDRMGDMVDPTGWDLTDFSKNPVALLAHGKHDPLPIGTWSDIRVERGALKGKLNFAKPGTSARVDEIRSLYDQGILRGASVGFKPLEVAPLPGGRGVHYKRSKLIECSLVAVPANSNALRITKALGLKVSDDTLNFVFGEQATEDAGIVRRNLGEHAATSPIPRTRTMDISLAKRIEDAQATLLRAKDTLTAHLADDKAEPEVGDALTTEIEVKTLELERLKRAEKALAAHTVERDQEDSHNAVVVTNPRPFAVPAKKVPPHEYVFRAATCAIRAHLQRRTIDDVRRECYGDDEATKIITDVVTKAASAPATTTTSGWASQLVQTVNVDFMESLTPAAVFPSLSARGLKLNFGRAGVISVPTRAATPTIAGSFVGEGAPIPVRQGAFTSTPLTPKKMAVISTFTREIANHSVPAIEGLIRDAIQDDTSVALDTVLLDAVAASTIRPAGLRNGVTPLTGTAGANFDAAVSDILKMSAELVASTAGNVRSPTWIMNPSRALSLSMRQNAGGDFPFQAELAAGNLRGWPIIVSGTADPTTIILLDAADFVSVTGDEPEFTVSDQATLHMEDTAPVAIGSTGTPTVVAAPVRSLFQTDTVAIRMILPMNWAMRRAGVVSVTTGVTW